MTVNEARKQKPREFEKVVEDDRSRRPGRRGDLMRGMTDASDTDSERSRRS